MNAIERVYKRLKGDVVDRAPNTNIIMQFAARYIGVKYGEYCTDYRYLAEANIKCCRDFGIDMVSAISDPVREASGLGSIVIVNDDNVPYCKEPLIKHYSDLKKIKKVLPHQSERMLDRIKAIEYYKENAGKEFPILGWCEGPLSLAGELRGVNEICMDLIDQPEFVEELMDICLEISISFAQEQIKAGADFIGVGDAAASLIGPKLYQEYVMPREKRLINSIHEAEAKAKLHICGNITPLLELLPSTGADIIDIDWMVDFEKANKIFNGKTCACGNFDPVKILLQGTTEDVKNSVKECLMKGDKYTFISAGCEVPKYTPYENLKAVTEALYEFSR